MAAENKMNSVRGRNVRSGESRLTFSKKPAFMFACIALLLGVLVGGTLAWLSAKTDPVINTFTAGKTGGEIEEEFDGTVKKNVRISNTGTVDAYVRVKLVSYRADEDGNPIGGDASIEGLVLMENWVKFGDYYYYTQPVPAGQETGVMFEPYTLKEYDDADGGKQVIEVMAELIQSDPQTAVQDAWGVTISNGIVIPAGN